MAGTSTIQRDTGGTVKQRGTSSVSRLEDAAEAAEARKLAALGDDTVGVLTADEQQSRAVFSGFDLDFEELNATSARAGTFFAEMVANTEMSLRTIFTLAWTDAFLLGLMVASLPPTPSESDDPAPSGSEGGETNGD